MKKKSYFFTRIIIILNIIYILTFLLCKYWNYMENSHVYILTSSREDGYGITDDGQFIDWSYIRYFEGVYIRTLYNSMSEIKKQKSIITISLNHPFQVDKLYVTYPQMRVFIIYKDLIFEMEHYDQNIYNLLSNLWLVKDRNEN